MRKAFCPLPWILLATRNDGKTRLCAQSHSSAEKGLNKNEKKQPLTVWEQDADKVRNSEFMKSIRRQFLKGEFPEACIRCEKETQAGLRTRPDYESVLWKDHITPQIARLSTHSDGSIDTNKNPILYMDLRLGNLCNLACRTCNPTESSSWYKDHYMVWGKKLKTDLKEPVTIQRTDKHYQLNGAQFDWGNSEDIPPLIRSHLDQVLHIHFSGGEPLILKSHQKVLDYLITTKRAKDITLEYITNSTVFPKNLLEKWDQFKQIKLGISIDGVGEINNYIRYPSQWETIEKNIQIIDNKNYSSWLALTVHAYNIYYLPEIITWRLHQDFKRICNTPSNPLFSDHPLHNPSFLSTQVLPLSIKKTITDRLIQFSKEIDLSRFPREYSNKLITNNSIDSFIDGHLEFMNTYAKPEKDFQKFILFTNKLDSSRDCHSHKSIPEFMNLISEV